MNKLQKRELRKKRKARQKYLKYEAPLDRLEDTLLHMKPERCQSMKDGVRCDRNAHHNELVHVGTNINGYSVYWIADMDTGIAHVLPHANLGHVQEK